MYVFSDPVVLDSLARVVNAYGRIGEYISIAATPAALRFSVINGSLSVIARCEFSSTIFSGSGTTRNVHVKARALEVVLRRLESKDVVTMQLRFRAPRSGHEQLDVEFVGRSGVRKTFNIACLHSTLPPLDLGEVLDRPLTFACTPAVLNDAFASCELGADEAKISFHRGVVNLVARRRGRAGGKNDATVLGRGLKTIIGLEPESFEQITALTPWQAEIKLKEFRVMLSFLDNLGENITLRATFGRHGPTTPLVFRATMPVPAVELKFQFLAKLTVVPQASSSDAESWLCIGPQPDWLTTGAYGPRTVSASRAASASVHSGGGGADQAMQAAQRERERRLRRVAAVQGTHLATSSRESTISQSSDTAVRVHQDRSAASGAPQSVETVRARLEEPEQGISSSIQRVAQDLAEEDRREAEHEATEEEINLLATEVGFTQAPADMRGLFD